MRCFSYREIALNTNVFFRTSWLPWHVSAGIPMAIVNQMRLRIKAYFLWRKTIPGTERSIRHVMQKKNSGQNTSEFPLCIWYQETLKRYKNGMVISFFIFYKMQMMLMFAITCIRKKPVMEMSSCWAILWPWYFTLSVWLFFTIFTKWHMRLLMYLLFCLPQSIMGTLWEQSLLCTLLYFHLGQWFEQNRWSNYYTLEEAISLILWSIALWALSLWNQHMSADLKTKFCLSV